jgi:hypothetical protein
MKKKIEKKGKLINVLISVIICSENYVKTYYDPFVRYWHWEALCGLALHCQKTEKEGNTKCNLIAETCEKIFNEWISDHSISILFRSISMIQAFNAYICLRIKFWKIKNILF